MTIKKQDSINVRIFMALKVSEMSKVPVLIMSNPGLGKTTSVEMYAKLRKDEQGRPMDVVVLRGNSESPEAIHGYETVSTAPVKPGEPVISSHTRPSWMQRILDNYAQGIRTILFLDELTTANEYVQAALLMLIFDRKCGVESLPPISHCLIVAAGNYMNNLTTSMTMISPVLNRFMIFNVTPVVDDLSDFLCKYKGAMTTGKVTDHLEEVEKQLVALDKQELDLSEENLNKIGEYFEKSISETTRLLMTRGGKIDLSVTNLKDLYGDVDDDDPNLYGFPTFRTLNYLRDISIACYKCFGKYGIQSDNFRSMIDGLCGIGLTKETSGSSKQIIIKTHKIGQDYWESLTKTAVELDKLSSSKLPEYVNYFTGMINTATYSDRKKEEKGKFTSPELHALKNKLEEMMKDPDMKSIEKPLEAETIQKLGDILTDSAQFLPKLDYGGASGSGDDVTKALQKAGLTSEGVAGFITTWNTLAGTYNMVRRFINMDQWNYPTTTKDIVSTVGKALSRTGTKVVAMKRITSIAYKGTGAALPEVDKIEA